MKFQLSLAQRIGIGFFLLIGLLLFGSGFGLWFSSLINDAIFVTQGSLSKFEYAVALEGNWANVAGVVDKMLLTRQSGGQIEAELSASQQAFSEALDALGTLESDDEEIVATVTTLETIGGQLLEQVDDIAAVSRSGQWARAQVIRHTEMASLQRRFDTALADFTLTAEQEVKESVARMSRVQEFLSTNWSVVAVLTFIAAAGVVALSVRSVTRPIRELTEQARRVTGGDYSPIQPLRRNDEIGELSRAFAQMNDRVRESYQEMEQRVQERTRALETSVEVSRSLSTILDPKKLVAEVVEQVRAAFDYYHVHIYLYEDNRESLQMVGGTGEAGLAMLAQSHQIPTGKGLVGRAAVAKEAILIPDVTQSADWLPNPLLPDTKAETAVPIMLGDEVLGVLDVQQNVVDGLSEEDVNLLQAVANQVAVALRNARAYEQAQARAQKEAVLNQISQRLQTAMDVESVLRIAAKEVGQALGAKYTDVQIGRRQPANGRSAAGKSSTSPIGGET